MPKTNSIVYLKEIIRSSYSEVVGESSQNEHAANTTQLRKTLSFGYFTRTIYFRILK